MEDEDNFKCNLCDKAYRYEGTLKTHIVVKHCKSNSYNHNENINGDNVVKADEDNKEGVKDEKSSVENEKCVKGFENL